MVSLLIMEQHNFKFFAVMDKCDHIRPEFTTCDGAESNLCPLLRAEGNTFPFRLGLWTLCKVLFAHGTDTIYA